MATGESNTLTEPLMQGQPDVLRMEDSCEMREDPDQQSLMDEIQALKPEDLPEELRASIEKLKETYEKAGSISVLMTGKSGAGKSTLINGILGLEISEKGVAKEGAVKKVAKEGRRIKEACTTDVTKYEAKKGKITVTVWDSPGLQDGTDNQEEYLQQMEEKCADRDITMYCIRVTEGRFVHGADNPDMLALEKLTKKFGVDFWKNTIIVLTFANIIEPLNPEWEDMPSNEKASAFQGVIQEWADQIREILVKDIKVPLETVRKIGIVSAGHYRKPHLPNHNHWLSALWFHCLATISDPEAQVALVALNAGRLKREAEVKNEDFKQPVHKQPIVVQREEGKIQLVAGTQGGRAIIGGLRGLAMGALGFALGPVGFVSVPLGIIIGAIAGTDSITLRKK